MISRIFDIVANRAHLKPEGILMGAKKSGKWKYYTNQFVWETAQKQAIGIQQLGIAPCSDNPELQEKIILIAPNSPEWIITDLAVQLSGAVLTPLYTTAGLDDVHYILEQTAARIVFIGDRILYERYKTVLARNNIQHIFSFDEVEGVTSWETLWRDKEIYDTVDTNHIHPQTLASIIYTSGTTGNSKGVMLSHHNILSNIESAMFEFYFVDEHDKAISFLPLNHIFERTVFYLYVQRGLIIYFAEHIDKLADNLREIKPEIFTTVPRLLEKVYEKIVSKGLSLKGIPKALFFWAHSLGLRYNILGRNSIGYKLQLWLARKIIFSKWQEALGGNIKAIVTGSAACQPRLIQIFTAAGIPILEGYGLTEASPVVSVNCFDPNKRRLGTVGLPLKYIDVKLAEDGEVLVKGENVMMGYYKMPDQTREVLRDGWLYTGDIGEWVDEHFLKLTDRKKEIIKTSGGKYVAPQPIENKMKESPFIDQIMVCGEGRKHITALIVPAFDTLKSYLEKHHLPIPQTREALVCEPYIKALIQEQLEKRSEKLGKVEQIKQFALLPAPWSIETGELTPTMKLKRKVINQKYKQEIEKLYGIV